MIDNRDEKLHQLLESRRLEPASPDLAGRIILAAQRLPQHQAMPLWQWLAELFAEFYLPKPGYVLASALVLGMLIGFNAPEDVNNGVDDSAPIVQNFFSADETWL
jgi:hypothetical protein